MATREQRDILTKEATGQAGPLVDPLQLLARLIVRELRDSVEPGEAPLDVPHLRGLSCKEEGEKG
jgi:hypothetical protein